MGVFAICAFSRISELKGTVNSLKSLNIQQVENTYVCGDFNNVYESLRSIAGIV